MLIIVITKVRFLFSLFSKVGGERPPDQVYSDFRIAFDRIVNATENDTNVRPRSTGTFARTYKSQETEQGDDSASIVNLSTSQNEKHRKIIWIGKLPIIFKYHLHL